MSLGLNNFGHKSLGLDNFGSKSLGLNNLKNVVSLSLRDDSKANKYLCGNLRNYCFVPITSNSGQTILKGPFQTGQPVDFSFSMLYAKSKLKKMFPIPLICVSYTKPAKNKFPNNTQA